MPRPKHDKTKPYLTTRAGRRKFYIEWTEDGKTKRRSTGTESRQEAEAVLGRFIDELNAVGFDPTVKDILARRYDSLEARNAQALKRAQNFHNQINKVLGKRRVSELDRLDLITDYMKKRADKTSALIRELEELRAALKQALRRGWIPGPIPAIDLPAKPEPREVFMTQEQAQKLLNQEKPYHVHLFMLIALTTGRRSGAILDLTWNRVDLEKKTMDFRNPEKPVTNKKRGVSTIPPHMISVLTEAKKVAQSDHVIEFNGNQVGSVKKSFGTAASNVGLDWVTPHVLKHSVISWLYDKGYSDERVANMTDTDIKTCRRIYLHWKADQHADMAEDLASGLFFSPVERKTNVG